MGSIPERGAYGNARGKPNKQVRNRRNREADPRYQAAMEQVHENQRRIDAEALAKGLEPVGRPTLVYVKQPVEELVTHPQYAPCHCGHAAHPTGVCYVCPEENFCEEYRPTTSPDPMAAIGATSEELEYDLGVLRSARLSPNRSTVTLGARIEAMLNQLEERLVEEDRELKAAEQNAAAIAEVTEQMEALQAKLAELTGAPVAPIKIATGKRSYNVKYGEYPCPSCDREPLKSPQALGVHRARAHGYRKGDDDK